MVVVVLLPRLPMLGCLLCASVAWGVTLSLGSTT